MKVMVLAATLCFGTLVHAQQMQCFNCTGYVGRDNVQVSGCFTVFERPDGRTVYRTEGNLDVNGTDGGAQLWSGRRAGSGTSGYFEQVRYFARDGVFYVKAKADNGSKLDIEIPDVVGDKVRARNMEMTLVRTDTRPEYWHQFDRATCER